VAHDWKYGQVTTERGTIAPDEPVFVIRGRDMSAPDAIDAYASAAALHGADDELVSVVHERAEAMREWQRQHPDSLKVPDIAPGQIVRD
jgi:hypothetical protein